MIGKLTYPVLAFFHFLGGYMMVFWASTSRAHPLTLEKTLEKFGIRVVAPKDHGSWDNHGEVYTALLLLGKYASGKLKQVKKYIRVIFLRPVDGPACYVKAGHLCHLSMPKQCPERMIPVAIAGTLVYLATLAELKSKVKGCAIQNLCEQEGQQIVKTLSRVTCK